MRCRGIPVLRLRKRGTDQIRSRCLQVLQCPSEKSIACSNKRMKRRFSILHTHIHTVSVLHIKGISFAQWTQQRTQWATEKFLFYASDIPLISIVPQAAEDQHSLSVTMDPHFAVPPNSPFTKHIRFNFKCLRHNLCFQSFSIYGHPGKLIHSN